MQLATHHTRPLSGARFQPASDIVICKPSVVIVVWSSSATIAPGQAQWHPDPPFPLVAILISEVTSFSCAIVNVLASRLPQEGSDSARLIIQRWLSFSGFIVRGYYRRGGELIKRAGSTMCFVRPWGPGLYLLFDAMKYCFSSEGSQEGLTNRIFFLWFFLMFFHHCPYWGNFISQMLKQGGQLLQPTGLMLCIHVFRSPQRKFVGGSTGPCSLSSSVVSEWGKYWLLDTELPKSASELQSPTWMSEISDSLYLECNIKILVLPAPSQAKLFNKLLHQYSLNTSIRKLLQCISAQYDHLSSLSLWTKTEMTSQPDVSLILAAKCASTTPSDCTHAYEKTNPLVLT